MWIKSPVYNHTSVTVKCSLPTLFCSKKFFLFTLDAIHLALYVLHFHMKHKNVSVIYIIPPHWHDSGSWNISSCKGWTYILYIVNIMGFDDLLANNTGTICLILFFHLMLSLWLFTIFTSWWATKRTKHTFCIQLWLLHSWLQLKTKIKTACFQFAKWIHQKI